MIKGYEGTLYGTYRTKKFSDVWETAQDFIDDYNNIGIPTTIPASSGVGTQGSITVLFYLLYSRHGNDIVASYDPNQFKYKLFSIVWQYGPNWVRELSLQDTLRNMSEEDIERGSIQVYNSASNPSTDPSTSTEEYLQYINNQNVSKSKKGKLEGYMMLESLLKKDVTEEFLSKFKPLFKQCLEPEELLLYPELIISQQAEIGD